MQREPAERQGGDCEAITTLREEGLLLHLIDSGQ